MPSLSTYAVSSIVPALNRLPGYLQAEVLPVRGSGPTAAAMLLGYWDGLGYENLVPGSARSQTPEVNNLIYHLALLMETSAWGIDEGDGWTRLENLAAGLADHAAWAGYPLAVAGTLLGDDLTWEAFRAEIDAERPVVLLVDADGDGTADRYVTAIGYAPQSGRYFFRDPDLPEIQSFLFTPIMSGQPYGVEGAVTFNVVPELSAVVLLAVTLLCFMAWDTRRSYRRRGRS